MVGAGVGLIVGAGLGFFVGLNVGLMVGLMVGSLVGSFVGRIGLSQLSSIPPVPHEYAFALNLHQST